VSLGTRETETDIGSLVYRGNVIEITDDMEDSISLPCIVNDYRVVPNLTVREDDATGDAVEKIINIDPQWYSQLTGFHIPKNLLKSNASKLIFKCQTNRTGDNQTMNYSKIGMHFRFDSTNCHAQSVFEIH